MKKVVFLLAIMLIGVPSAVLGADGPARTAILTDIKDSVWEVTDLYSWTVPGPFLESRFRLTVVTDTFHVAIPPENLISIEKKGENFEIRYRWLGQEQSISGRITSDQIGGKSSVGLYYVKIGELKRLTFKEGSGAIKEEKPPSYEFETILLLTNGTKIPVANLVRISSQLHAAVPFSGWEEFTVFGQLNDVGFLQEKNAPTIKFEDVKSMEFPTEDTIVLTLKRLPGDNGNKGKNDSVKEAKADKVEKEDIDEDYEFLKGDLGDLDIDFGEDENAARKSFPKNWAYGFTGIYSKGYFFIPARHVKAIEFGVEQE